MHNKDYTVYGFTLLELIVVLTGLGILSSLAIPNYMKYLDYAKVDEAKALLNNAAADCLQGLRRDPTKKRIDEPVDNGIISYTRLINTGYVFQKRNGDQFEPVTDPNYLPNCEEVRITAAIEEDRKKRHPDLGFYITKNGVLGKSASDSGSETKFPADSWAGAATAKEEDLIKWLKLNEDIDKAKEDCRKSLDNFTTGKTMMWDEEKTKSCTDRPPVSETPETCTADGCTKPVWYLDGELCGYSDTAFRDCLKAKTSAACQADKDSKAAEKPPWTSATIAGDQLPNCEEPVWFFEGEDVGSAEAWKPLMCKKNINDLLSTTHSGPVEYCEVEPIYIIGGKEVLPHPASRDDAKAEFEKLLDENKDAKCTQALNEDAIKRPNGGPYNSPTPSEMSPPLGADCNTQYWYCIDKIYRDQPKYDADERCKKANCGSPPSADCDNPKYYNDRKCRPYNKCKGRIP